MATLLCINPRSRNGDRASYEPLIESLHRLGPVVIHEVGSEEDLDEAIAALGDSLERIVVAGGDGTLNRLLPVVRKAGVPLGVLPLGTANDFARSLGLPSQPDAAAEVIVEGKTRKVDLATANGRLFLNAAGIGLGPELTKKLDREKKRRLGVLAYLQSLIQVAGNYRRRRATVHVNGRRERAAFMQITVANGRHYGGGLTVAEDATLDDGRLHVLLVRPQKPLELLGRFFTLKHGRPPENGDRSVRLMDSDRVRIETRQPCEVTVDGELATRTPLECECVPEALEVYAPAPSE